jgi:hypothetical protein
MPRARLGLWLALTLVCSAAAFSHAETDWLALGAQQGLPIVPRAQWGAAPPITARMRAQTGPFRCVTIHHTAEPSTLGADELRLLRGDQRYHQQNKKWGDIAYHFLIGPSGAIYEGRSPAYVADTATNYDPAGHLTLCLLGNFEEQQPTPAAEEALVRLTALVLAGCGLTPADVATHRDVAATLCPGRHLREWLRARGMDQIRREVMRLPGGKAAIAPPTAPPLLLRTKDLSLIVPIAGLSIQDFLRQSILYRPKDWVRDGLPQFGAWRDDWLGKPRRHEGLDIYGVGLTIQAAAAGRVAAVGTGKRAGLFVKLEHGRGVATSYIHLTTTAVKVGERVVEGATLGRVDGPAGNGVEPQLHFELRVKGKAVDPVPLVREAYAARGDGAPVVQAIDEAAAQFPAWAAERDAAVTSPRRLPAPAPE